MKLPVVLILTFLSGLLLAGTPPPAQPFKPTWQSLESQYQTPAWFRDAKFGIWAHWSAQSQPEQGDWYARNLYLQGSHDYEYQVAHYGHPTKAGFKEVIHEWRAEHFDPEKLLAFYQANGAKYFMALAVHCDNFDNYNSKYQPWNSVKLGPHRDLIGAWSAAAHKLGLRFGVSVHDGGWSWRWYEVAQRADTNGPLAGVPYDGKLTKADGHGLWWDGLDPQDLYAQNHSPGAPPDAAYCEKFCRRTTQLWDDYRPDLIYFDENALPLHRLGAPDAYGLGLYAHFYNTSLAWHGTNEAVITAKMLNPGQRQGLVYDIERGKTADILPQPWQTDTCLGDWHYSRSLFEKHQYKTAAMVIPMLVDIVSKNGNLMLSVPVRADGTIDTDEQKILAEIGAWLKVNGPAIYGTRPWQIYGEGPATTETAEKGGFDGVKDVRSKPYTAQDIRFTQSKDGSALFAVVLAFPAGGKITIQSLAERSPHWPGSIGRVQLLGDNSKLRFTRDQNGLHVTMPSHKPCAIAFALKITK